MIKNLIITIIIVLFCLNVGCKSNSINGDFDTKKALELVYGKLTYKNGKYEEPVIWKDIKIPARLEHIGGWSKDIIKGEVSTIFDGFYKENSVEKHIVLTQTKPLDREFECHACPPLIGGMIFKKLGNKWMIESKNKYITISGKWGSVDNKISLMKIGSNKFGVKITGDDMHQGYESTRISLITSYKSELLEVFSIITEILADPTVEIKTKLALTSPIELKFVQGKDPEFYEIEVLLLKTKKEGKRNILFDEQKLFRFNEGKYIETDIVK